MHKYAGVIGHNLKQDKQTDNRTLSKAGEPQISEA